MSEINTETMILLGETDQIIFDLNMKLKAIPHKINEASKQLAAEKKQLQEVLIPHDKLVEEIRERESASKLAVDTIEKFEDHMKKVTTQKEYLAARKQVDEARKLNDRLQEEILERRIKQEELTPVLKERQERYDNVLESFTSAEAVLTKEKKALEAKITEHTTVVDKHLQDLGPTASGLYKRLVKGGKMPGIVAVVSGSCNGCNMALPPQLYNLLIAADAASDGKMFTCPTCSRIIFYKPPEAEAEEETPVTAAAG